MRSEVAAARAGLTVRRCFEDGRLGGDNQARAYAQLVPAESPRPVLREARPHAGGQRAGDPGSVSLTEEGVAA